MGKKMKLLPSLSKSSSSSSSSSYSLWQWPSCKHPKTHSFRGGDDIFKTVNSVYFDGAGSGGVGDVMLSTSSTTTTAATPESWFTNSSDESAGSFSSVSELESGEESLEIVIRGLRISERLFFEPGNTNSILEEAKVSSGFPFKESLVLAMESEDPYVDFRTSMEEMVEAHGLKDWDCLEELLSWYLRVNGKNNHGFIVGAFVDLLVGLAASSASSSASTDAVPCAPSSSSDSCSVSLYSLLEEEEEEEEEDQEEEKVKEMCCLEISEI